MPIYRYCHACRFAELRHSLGLYGLDPNHKLHSPRAELSDSERTFASSNYLSLLLQIASREKAQKSMSTFIVVRAVEELIKIYAPENWGQTFGKELEQCKGHKSFTLNDVAVTAQYLCTCGCSEQLG